MLKRLMAGFLATGLAVACVMAQDAPLTIRQQGYFFVGQSYVTVGDKQFVGGRPMWSFRSLRSRPIPIP